MIMLTAPVAGARGGAHPRGRGLGGVRPREGGVRPVRATAGLTQTLVDQQL
jgi:hypothetical protein